MQPFYYKGSKTGLMTLLQHKRQIEELEKCWYTARLEKNYVAMAASIKLLHLVSPTVADRHWRFCAEDEKANILAYV